VSLAALQRKAKVAELEDKIESAKQRKTALDGEIAALTDGREDTVRRDYLWHNRTRLGIVKCERLVLFG
jgi:cell division protein FtsB